MPPWEPRCLPEWPVPRPSAPPASKRVIFFLQNQGFEPATCIPAGMKNSGSLAKAKLPEPIEALEPFKERLHIINGLHGLHTSPSHSAFFGALGGYRGSDGVPPSGPDDRLRAEQGATRDAPAPPVYRHGLHREHDGASPRSRIFRPAVRASRSSCIPTRTTSTRCSTGAFLRGTSASSTRRDPACSTGSKQMAAAKGGALPIGGQAALRPVRAGVR